MVHLRQEIKKKCVCFAVVVEVSLACTDNIAAVAFWSFLSTQVYAVTTKQEYDY